MEQNNNLDSWDKFQGTNWLKASEIKEKQKFIVFNVIEEIVQEKHKVQLEIESNKIKYLFELNKTNIGILQELGVKSPKEMMGYFIEFKIVKVQNPETKREVDGIRIKDIMKPL